MSQHNNIFIVCTGLGKVRRGFETYIADLGNLLTTDISLNAKISVFSGAEYRFKKFQSKKVLSISRNSKFLQLFFKDTHDLFAIEQFTFFISFIFKIIYSKPKIIYLGEYNLYCYLYKFRKIMGLKYSLVLFTGGQAFPGLFNNSLDFVHHVTDVYYKGSLGNSIPKSRQFLVPHFLNIHSAINFELYDSIRLKARNRTIVLAAGLIDLKVKRLHVLIECLEKIKDKVFPIFLGEESPDSPFIRNQLISIFGINNFLISKVDRQTLPTYYSIASVLTSFSLHESFGLVNLEAMYWGTPVVCHQYEEAKFVIGKIIELRNLEIASDDISNLILTYSSDIKYPELRQFVIENYSQEKLKNEYELMFNSFLAN